MNKIRYDDLIELGFKREDYTDVVHSKEYGWEPFSLQKYLTESILLEYNCESQTVRLLRCDDIDFKILGKIENLTLDQIKELLLNK